MTQFRINVFVSQFAFCVSDVLFYKTATAHNNNRDENLGGLSAA